MPRFAIVVALTLLAACGGGATYQVSIRNASARTIEKLVVYHGSEPSRPNIGPLAPGASKTVRMKEGSVTVSAESEKINIDEHHRDKPTAEQTIELTHPVQLIFYDDGSTPPGIDKKDVIGVAFQIPKAESKPDDSSAQPATPDGDQPAPQAP